MINLNIKFFGARENPYEYEVNKTYSQNETIHLSPLLLSEDLNGHQQHGIKLEISGTYEGISILIEDFEHVTLRGTLQDIAEIAYLTSRNCSYFEVLYLNIKRFDIDIPERESTRIHLGNNTIKEFRFGIESSLSHMASANSPSMLPVKSIRIELINTSISILHTFIPISDLCFHRSTIDNVFCDHSVQSFQIYSSSIANVQFSKEIFLLSISTSIIHNAYFLGEVNQLLLEASTIEHSHGCNNGTFTIKTLDAWTLIINSARNNNDLELFMEASYCYMDLKRKLMKCGLHKKLFFFMNWICGYGYKPHYTVGWIIGTWIIFGFVFSLGHFGEGLSLPKLPCGSVYTYAETLGYSLYLSIITFSTTGYGDITPSIPWLRFVAGIESIWGITLMSIFAVSLFKRFGSTL